MIHRLTSRPRSRTWRQSQDYMLVQHALMMIICLHRLTQLARQLCCPSWESRVRGMGLCLYWKISGSTLC